MTNSHSWVGCSLILRMPSLQTQANKTAHTQPSAPSRAALFTDAAVASVSLIPVAYRRALMVAWDVGAWGLALLASLVIRYDFQLSNQQWAAALSFTACVVVAQVTAGLLSHVYLGRNPVGSFRDAVWLAGLVGLTALPLGLVFALATPTFPRGVAVVLPPVALLLMLAARWAFRALLGTPLRRHAPPEEASPALVYGAGDAGHQVARMVDRAAPAPYDIVGFVDDDPAKRFLHVRGYRVLGTGKALLDVARERGAETVILAISHAEARLIQQVSDRCQAAGLRLVVVPPVREMIDGRMDLGALREFNVVDLLGRRPIETDTKSVAGYITGHAVLITGAGGSIGSELARQVYRLGPARLILVDRDESALHAVQLSLYGSGLLDTDDMVLCDIRDREALQAVFERHRPEVVFHAAALKHLPMLERFPAEGWKTNVLGTANVLHCGREVGVRHFVNISTDKAADATSVLGATKRYAERLTAHAALETGRPYVSVRFGNVLGSRGSVLDTFRWQIEQGGPLTITDPDVTRFFMTIPEACQLVLQAGAIGEPGDALVLDMGEPVRILDIARRLISQSGRRIDIAFTGLRPGEKLHELLFSSIERGIPSAHPMISQVAVPPLSPSALPTQARQISVALGRHESPITGLVREAV